MAATGLQGHMLAESLTIHTLTLNAMSLRTNSMVKTPVNIMFR